jgi:hypothetical protein
MGTIKQVETTAEQSEKLSDALRELGFLPRGYGYLVRVRGESRKKRQSASFEKSWSPDTDSIQIRFERKLGRAQANSQQTASGARTDPPSPTRKLNPSREVLAYARKLYKDLEKLGKKIDPKEAFETAKRAYHFVDTSLVEYDEEQITRAQSQAGLQPRASAAAATPPSPAPTSTSATDHMSDLIKALDRAESQPGYSFVALKWFRDTALPSEGFAWANAASVREALRDCIDKRLVLTSKVPNPRSPEFPVTAIRLNRLMPEVRAILGTEDGGMPDFQPVPIRGENLSATVLRERR